MALSGPLIIGIAGGSGSGKTSVTNAVLGHLDPACVTVIQHDSYYRDISWHGGKPPSEVNFDHPAALETDLLVRHLQELRSWRPVDQPLYDFTTHTRRPETRRVEPREIVIIDGILIFADRALRELNSVSAACQKSSRSPC